MAQWGRLKYAQKSCLSLTGKLMQRTGMLWPGARVGLAVSGGMDSMVMLQVLLLRQRIVPFPFELFVLHLNPGFEPESHLPLIDWLENQGVAGHLEVTDYGRRAHSEENRKKSPCFFCAWHRRKRLFTLCKNYGLTHLALGHTTDDLVSTFFMNMVKTGKIYGMQPKERFFGGELTLIRPLLLIDKTVVAQARRQWELPLWENACPSKDTTARSAMLEAVRELCGPEKRLQTNVRNALRRWQVEMS